MKFFGKRFGRAPQKLDLAKIEAVWFDLDGTLVDVDMQAFVPAYLQRLAKRMVSCADPRRTAMVMRTAVQAMLSRERGSRPLEELLYDELERVGIPRDCYRESLAACCGDELAELAPLVRAHPLARTLVESCVQRGWQVLLATNPIFPRTVVDARLAWSGLSDLPFVRVTSYETAQACKPHRQFFDDLLAETGLVAEKCLMVGNDTEHDLAAGRVGMTTALLTPWQIDRPGVGFPADWQGDHVELLQAFLGVADGLGHASAPGHPAVRSD